MNAHAHYRHTPTPWHPDGCWCEDCWQPVTLASILNLPQGRPS